MASERESYTVGYMINHIYKNVWLSLLWKDHHDERSEEEPFRPGTEVKQNRNVYS